MRKQYKHDCRHFKAILLKSNSQKKFQNQFVFEKDTVVTSLYAKTGNNSSRANSNKLYLHRFPRHDFGVSTSSSFLSENEKRFKQATTVTVSYLFCPSFFFFNVNILLEQAFQLACA